MVNKFRETDYEKIERLFEIYQEYSKKIAKLDKSLRDNSNIELLKEMEEYEEG